MDLPEGVYIVSNRRKTVGPNKFEPVFQEQVAALEERQAPWERIKAAGANGKWLCTVYVRKEDYEKSKSSH